MAAKLKPLPHPKLDEARAILAALGMPRKQQNELSVYTFVALCGLKPDMGWGDASALRRSPRDIMEFLESEWQRTYTDRETVRKDALQPFARGAIAIHNPDDPKLPINSPHTHHALSDEALAVIHAFGTDNFDGEVKRFTAAVSGGLAQRLAHPRTQREIEITLPDGSTLKLSPGKHNELQRAIVEEFRPRFAPEAELLYIGDTARKDLYRNEPRLAALGLDLSAHGKLPDVILYDPGRRWLFMVEAVASVGPVSEERRVDLEGLLPPGGPKAVYVSAFLDFAQFKRHAAEIAWDTEVWLAEAPEHLLHYNGDRFLGPRP